MNKGSISINLCSQSSLLCESASGDQCVPSFDSLGFGKWHSGQLTKESTYNRHINRLHLFDISRNCKYAMASSDDSNMNERSSKTT